MVSNFESSLIIYSFFSAFHFSSRIISSFFVFAPKQIGYRHHRRRRKCDTERCVQCDTVRCVQCDRAVGSAVCVGLCLVCVCASM